VFKRSNLLVFCDGDFWHGRDLEKRVERLAKGHNPAYWLSKITRNVERDRATNEALAALGWQVLRFWETDIKRDADGIAAIIHEIVRRRPAT
jgi:DNA mismatch endonuclease, patch repair protein